MTTMIHVTAVAVMVVVGACSSSDDPNAADAVCVDRAGYRVPDSECGSDERDVRAGYVWFYLYPALTQPMIGAQVSNSYYYVQGNPYGNRRPPSDVPVRRAVPDAGAQARTVRVAQQQAKAVNQQVPIQDARPQSRSAPISKPVNPAPKAR